MITIKQEFYSDKDSMLKVCKEKISKTLLAANFVYVANVMSVKDSCISRDKIGRHT